ncbi:MAG: PTS sugar transporter subunit IIA, partial [Planctomycetota bacterium]
MAYQKRRDQKTVRDVVPHDVTVRTLRATTRSEAITELLNVLVIDGVLPMDKERDVRDSILQRESVASTGIGNGIAIPHAKNKFADRLGLAVGLSDEGIEWNSHDGMDAYFVALWVCQPADTKRHLALMRGIAAAAQDPNTSGRLQACKDKKGLLALLEE